MAAKAFAGFAPPSEENTIESTISDVWPRRYHRNYKARGKSEKEIKAAIRVMAKNWFLYGYPKYIWNFVLDENIRYTALDTRILHEFLPTNASRIAFETLVETGANTTIGAFFTVLTEFIYLWRKDHEEQDAE